MPNFEVNNVSVSTLLGFVSDGTIAIPEIQRPFVWDSTKVRNLIDSLYKGYPVGYIITWKSPNAKLKDGTESAAIYSGNHSTFDKSPYQPGFYLSQEGLSIGDKIKINADGTMYAGNGAVNNSSANHWIINGVTDGNTYISYNTTSLGTTSYSVYLGTNGISLGTTFTVDSNGNLTSKSGTIGGWEIGKTELRAQDSSGKYIQLKNDGSIEGNYSENGTGWQIRADGIATFYQGRFGPWVVGTNDSKRCFQGTDTSVNSNSIRLYANGDIDGYDISSNKYKTKFWKIEDCAAHFSNGIFIGP